MTADQLNHFIDLFTDVHAVGFVYQNPSDMADKINKYYRIPVRRSQVVDSYRRRGIERNSNSIWVKTAA